MTRHPRFGDLRDVITAAAESIDAAEHISAEFSGTPRWARLALDIGRLNHAVVTAGTYLRERAHPWHYAPTGRVSDDVLVISAYGQWVVQIKALQELFGRFLAGHSDSDGALAVLETALVRVADRFYSEIFELLGASATRAGSPFAVFWSVWQVNRAAYAVPQPLSVDDVDDWTRATGSTAGKLGQPIVSVADAAAIADLVGAKWVVGAEDRDRDPAPPYEPLKVLSSSGLSTIRIPRRFGGPGLDSATHIEVLRRLARADASLAQLYLVDSQVSNQLERLAPDAAGFFAAESLRGARFGNATAERSRSGGYAFSTTLVADGADFLIKGEKYFCTGAFTADWIAVAGCYEDGSTGYAMVPRDAAGLRFGQDWDVIGQRTTLSYSVYLDDVRIPAAHCGVAATGSKLRGAVRFALSQLAHSAIEVGVSEGALRWVLDHGDRSTWDAAAPGRLREWFGENQLSWVLVDRAARLCDGVLDSEDDPTLEAAITAAVSVDEAKTLAYRVAVQWSQLVPTLAGDPATDLDRTSRFWRDSRTHSLHDPARWRQHWVGDYWLNGRPSPELARWLPSDD